MAIEPGWLCLECGLCCDGTLFHSVVLGDGEVADAVRNGLDVVRSDEGVAGFRQPCTAFRNGCCALWGVAQPALCVAYRCGLLRGYSAGRRSIDECREVIALTRTVTRGLEDVMGVGFGEFDRHKLDRALAAAVERGDDEARVALEVGLSRLEALLDSHFSAG